MILRESIAYFQLCTRYNFSQYEKHRRGRSLFLSFFPKAVRFNELVLFIGVKVFDNITTDRVSYIQSLRVLIIFV